MAKAATAAAPKAPAAKKPAAPAPVATPAAAVSLKMVPLVAGDAKKALASLEGVTKGSVVNIAPSKLKVLPGFNVRVRDNAAYKEAMDDLKASIKSEGFYPSKPLSGFVGKDGEEDVIYVTDGHRRLEATLQVIAEGGEISTVPVILRDPKTSVRDLNVALIKENSGAPLSMLEKAIVVKRLLNDQMSLGDIATTLNLTKRMAMDYQVLIQSPKTIRAVVSSLAITGTEAVRLLRKHVDKIEEPGKRDYSKAEKVILDLVNKAKESGKGKVTRKDSEAAEKEAAGETTSDEAENERDPKVSALVEQFTHNWKIEKGATFSLKDIKGFKSLFPNADWYEASTETAGEATALFDVTFKAVVTMPKKPEEIISGDEATGEETGDSAEIEGRTEEAVAEDGGEL